MSKTSFYGGPYDGLELTPDEAARKCIPLTIPSCVVNRFFLLLPHPDAPGRGRVGSGPGRGPRR